MSDRECFTKTDEHGKEWKKGIYIRLRPTYIDLLGLDRKGVD